MEASGFVYCEEELKRYDIIPAAKRKERKAFIVKQVLYQIYHSGFLGLIITHRLSQHKGDRAVLLVHEKRKELLDTCDKFLGSGLFDAILTYDAFAGMAQGLTEAEVEQTIQTKYDEHFADIGLDLGGFSNIYTSSDGRNCFTVYCSLKEVFYSPLELVGGFLGKGIYEKLRDYLGNIPNYRNVLMKHHALDAFGKNTVLVLHPDSSYQLDKPYVVFDETAAIQAFDDEDKRKILAGFDIDTNLLLRKERAIAVVCNEMLPVKNMSEYKKKMDLYFHTYQYVFDYYLPGQKIVVKPHPLVPWSDGVVANFFSLEGCFPPLFPMEFLTILQTDAERYELLFATSRSSLSKGSSLAKNHLFVPSSSYTDTVFLFNRFFLTFQVIQNLFSVWPVKLCLAYNGNLLQFVKHVMPCDNILTKEEPHASLTASTVHVMDDCSEHPFFRYNRLIEAPDDAVVFFIDRRERFERFLFEHENLLPHVVPLVIKKKKSATRLIYDLCQDEVVYAFCKSKTIRQEIMSFSLHRKLEQVGIDIQVEAVDDTQVQLYFLSRQAAFMKKQVNWLRRHIGSEKIISDGTDYVGDINEKEILAVCDIVKPGKIVGWSLDKKNPNKTVKVTVLDTINEIVAETFSTHYRGDLEKTGIGAGHGGYGYQLEGIFDETMRVVFSTGTAVKVLPVVFK